MAHAINPKECLARAAQERELASGATLQNVREQHLRSAKSWDELGSLDRYKLGLQFNVEEPGK